MSTEITVKLLDHISNSLKNGNVQSQLLAIYALQDAVEQLQQADRKDELAATINSNIENILNLAFNINEQIQDSNQDLLCTCLDILYSLFEIDASTTSIYSEKVTEFICLLLKTNKSDPLMADSVICLLDKLICIENGADKVVEKLTPTLVEILTDTEDQDALTLKCTAIEVFEHLAKEIRKAEKTGKSISENFFKQATDALFIPMMSVGLESDYSTDTQIIENITTTCKAIFQGKYGVDIMCNGKDGNGKSYLEYVLQFVSVVLDPEAAEEGATSIGKLVTTMVAKCGNQLQEQDILKQLLQACLHKLQKCQTISVQQSLLLVFGQLMCENLTAVLDFLNSVDATTFVFKLFVEKYNDFFGYMERKIGAIALSNLLKYLIENREDAKYSSLLMLNVNGEQIINNTQGDGKRMTRSKAAKAGPVEFKQIPLIVKLYKNLLSECQMQIDRQNNKFNETLDHDDNSEDDEWVEDDENIDPDSQPSNGLGLEGKNMTADEFLDGGCAFIEDDEDFFDEFEKADNPFGEVEICEHVFGVMKSVPFNVELKQEFSEDELRCAVDMGLC